MSTLETTKPTLGVLTEKNDGSVAAPTAASITAPAVASSISAGTVAAIKGKIPPKPVEEFYKDLQLFHERRGTPIMHTPKISGREVDLRRLYCEVTERGGFLKVNSRDEWHEVLPAIGLHEKCVNASAAMKHIYRRCLEKYERLNYFGEDPDKMEALEASDIMECGGRSRSRYTPFLHSTTGGIHSVPMSYNYRQHVVNMDRRRTYKFSTDLYQPTPYEKLVLALMSPLPNEQDFAINVCTRLANENKHTLRLHDCPKLLDILLAHAGIFADHTLSKLFQQVYADVRRHPLNVFWRDLLREKMQTLELQTDEKGLRGAALINKINDEDCAKQLVQLEDYCGDLEFLNLGPADGAQEYIGQRVQQITAILRSLSFFEENVPTLAKSRTFLRFIVMGANIRWSNIHNQMLEMAGNLATELELQDPSTDEVTRIFLSTICEGVESLDRGVIINCLEILYKLSQNDANEDYIVKCLNLHFYECLCRFLSLNDIMLLIFTLEAIYALTSLGARSCHLIMQVRGVVDQLVALITVEAQSYGPDGCILMRVVETVPGNMLPLVAQNIANLQTVAVLQKQQNFSQHGQHVAVLPPPPPPVPVQQQQSQSQSQLPIQQQQQQQQPQQQHAQPQLPTVVSDLHQQPLPQTHTHQQVTNVKPTVTQPTAQQPLQQASQVQAPQQIQAQTETPAQATPLPAAPSNCTHEDEQYALAWLSATFEQTGSTESRVEQQELYRMYLVHCQKAGKHSVVNNLQFPRLVRLIFNTGVGPAVVRRIDGTELPGLHYVAIRVRAQPLPIQGKPLATPPKKLKKKLKVHIETPQPQQKHQEQSVETTIKEASADVTANPSTLHLVEEQHQSANESVKREVPLATTTTVVATTDEQSHETNVNINNLKEIPKPQNVGVVAPQQQQKSMATVCTDHPQQHPMQQSPVHNVQPSSSVIKSLLANKVTQRQQKQKDLVITSTSTSSGAVLQSNPHASVLVTTASSLLQAQAQVQTQPQPIKVASTAISALVNNPLMQNTPVKVGQTTIKPLNPQLSFEKKPHVDSTPPPLAPLSGNNVAKDASGRPVIIANQMLVEMLDKKTLDPPLPATIVKRKLEDGSGTEMVAKRLALDIRKDELQMAPPKNAANLYAEFAASLLEDEDMEEIPTHVIQSPAQSPSPSILTESGQSLMIPAKLQQATLATGSPHGMQRQLLFQSNQPPQLKLTQPTGQQIPTAMATIKTDQGLQTVPVILQPKPLEATQQQLIQQVLQPSGNALPSATQTQYVLATNPQGQTYLVAQQSQPAPPPPPPTQTVLVTQTPQQQSTGAKTIIILQQQTSGAPQQIIASAPGGAQKMFVTTPQGQQVLLTQRAQPTMAGQQQQIFIGTAAGSAASAAHLQHMPPSTVSQPVTLNANLLQRQLLPNTVASQQQQTQQQQQTPTGQISPSLLSQLNHIPATIKLHQPGQQLTSIALTQPSHQQATISRLSKSVSIVQTTPATLPLPLPMPQLQQHQSIIQQHIISGPTEKRQVLLGGRPIEIKETVITQAHPPPQQSQLNSQTIITKQPPPAAAQQAAAIIVQQSQQQQQIRAVIEHQQQAHPSIIQQKITVPVPLPAQQTQGTATVGGAQSAQLIMPQKLHLEQSNLVQTKTSAQGQSVVQSILPQVAVTQATITTATATTALMKKPMAQAATQIKAQLQPTPPLQQQQQLPTTTNTAKAITGPPPLAVTTAASITTTTGTLQQQQQDDKTISATVSTPASTATAATTTTAVIVGTHGTTSLQIPSPMQTHHPQPATLSVGDSNWLYICDWRNCPRRKFKSLSDLQHHACSAHCPDHLDPAAEIFCQWGVGPGLCDGIPRKRYSLMTHLIDRHINVDGLRAAMQRRIATGTVNVAPSQPPVTIVRNVEQSQRGNSASPAPSTSSTGSLPSTGSTAIHAIKRHTADFVNPKELMDENEGPVTKSIRLTAALILRNLVTYTSTAKRSLRRYEPHLANVALSNVESSGAISHILFELNN